MAITVRAITAVAAQPSHASPRGSVAEPMTAARVDMCIMANMTGTATTPFSTALQ